MESSVERNLYRAFPIFKQSVITESPLSKIDRDDQLVKEQKNDPFQSVIFKKVNKIFIINSKEP